jgi:hypothetical protein
MKKKKILLCLCVGAISLAACSSKPDAGDVSQGIKKTWESCKLIQPTDFKKTNGIDQGSSYQMAISYKLEIVKDIAAADYLIPEYTYKQFLTEHPEVGYDQQEGKYRELLQAAAKRSMEYRDANCPGMNEFFLLQNPRIVEHVQKKAPFLKGESFDVSAEFTMVRSEKGWIAQ